MLSHRDVTTKVCSVKFAVNKEYFGKQCFAIRNIFTTFSQRCDDQIMFSQCYFQQRVFFENNISQLGMCLVPSYGDMMTKVCSVEFILKNIVIERMSSQSGMPGVKCSGKECFTIRNVFAAFHQRHND